MIMIAMEFERCSWCLGSLSLRFFGTLLLTGGHEVVVIFIFFATRIRVWRGNDFREEIRKERKSGGFTRLGASVKV
jgi:hypothetical protein